MSHMIRLSQGRQRGILWTVTILLTRTQIICNRIFCQHTHFKVFMRSVYLMFQFFVRSVDSPGVNWTWYPISFQITWCFELKKKGYCAGSNVLDIQNSHYTYIFCWSIISLFRLWHILPRFVKGRSFHDKSRSRINCACAHIVLRK